MVDSSFEEDSSFEGPSFKWISVNEKLVANGFCAVQSTKGPPEVRQIISQLIDDYARRGQRITELMTAQKSFIPAGGAPLNACGDARVLDRHLEKIQMLQNTVRELQEKGDEAQKASAATVRELHSTIRNLKLQLRQSEHRVKAKEVVADRLMERLKEQIDRERDLRERDRKAFMQIQRRPVSFTVSHQTISYIPTNAIT